MPVMYNVYIYMLRFEINGLIEHKAVGFNFYSFLATVYHL